MLASAPTSLLAKDVRRLRRRKGEGTGGAPKSALHIGQLRAGASLSQAVRQAMQKAWEQGVRTGRYITSSQMGQCKSRRQSLLSLSSSTKLTLFFRPRPSSSQATAS